jgi:uncharacterized membrane protein
MSATIFESKSLPDQSSSSSRTPILIWGLTAAVTLTILGFIVAAPLARAAHYPEIASVIYRTFSLVCHQIPDRSFHLAGFKFAVCSRCTGIYSGLAAAALVFPLTRSLRDTKTPARLWLVLAAAPLAIDFGLGYFSIWQNTHWSRFLTGALLGSVVVFFIIPGLIDLHQAVRNWRHRTVSVGDRG